MCPEMDTATEELYYQKLHELVFDNDQIVTIPSMARTLNISVQESQQILKQFTEDQNKLKSNQLTVIYVITGILKHENGRAVLMLEESNLKEKRGTFEKVSSEVIFSVQKCRNVDFNMISLVDKLNSTTLEKPLLGSIVGRNCVKGELKVKKLPSPQGPTIKSKTSFFKSKTENPESTVKPHIQPTNSSSKAKPSGSIADIFSKASTTNIETKEKSKTSENKSVSKCKGGLSGFLTKSSLKSSSNEDIKSKNGSNQNNGNSEDKDSLKMESIDDECKMDIEVEEKRKEAVKVKDELKTVERGDVKGTKKETIKNKQNKNKRQREKSEEKQTKRRKRIVERDDSESDDLFEKEVDEDIIDKSDEEPEIVMVEKKPLMPKNKIRRAVDKTYEDEEGFIVTKTEYVYETASEDEIQEPKADKPKEKEMEKKNSKTSVSSENDVSPKKGAKPKKGKKNDQNQPTLMNFFKKK